MAMPFCQYCGGKIDEDAVVCSECGGILVEEDTGWQQLQIQEKVDKAKHRANMYIIAATVLATVGIVAGCVLCASSSAIGFFGVALVCLGVGCNASADRHEHKARVLRRRLKQ
jgi:uncharacterized membrane protein YvbJ